MCCRQVVRYRHDPLFDALARMGFIAWIRQPAHLSPHPVSGRTGHYQAPVAVAVAGLTDTGRAASDRLTGLEPSGQWKSAFRAKIAACPG